jgi:hypothetical protein
MKFDERHDIDIHDFSLGFVDQARPSQSSSVSEERKGNLQVAASNICADEDLLKQQEAIRIVGSCPCCEDLDGCTILSPSGRGWPFPTLSSVMRSAVDGYPGCSLLCQAIDDFDLLKDLEQDLPQVYESQERHDILKKRPPVFSIAGPFQIILYFDPRRPTPVGRSRRVQFFNMPGLSIPRTVLS